jgi:lipid-A-disaccharide synthase
VPRIVIIAGEASGDLLGRGLIEALRQRIPDAQFEGITGPQMEGAGCKSWGSYEQLAVMGVFEVLRHLPRLLRLNKELKQRLLDDPPDVLIGIDAPDFNLRLEKFARKAGIRTVHYVCPSVWAWRQGRVKTIRESCDLVLCLLPFERDFVAQHGVNACFVGHPLADEIGADIDQEGARRRFNLPEKKANTNASRGAVVALLPGSRVGELQRLGADFLAAANWLRERRPDVQFVSAAASEVTATMFAEQCEAAGLTDAVAVLDGSARDAMAAADVVLVASGTATLETMLMQRPMVVAYKIAPLTAWILRATGIVKIKHFSMPNLLAGRELVPEILQEDVSGPALGAAVLQQLDNPEQTAQLVAQFAQLASSLRKSASDQAAAAVAKLLAAQ